MTPRLPRDPRRRRSTPSTPRSPPGAIVIGHSFGGVLALRLARERPRPLAALILSDCFFPPARNGRGTLASLRDYGAHRVAYLRDRSRRPVQGAPVEATSRSGGHRRRSPAWPASAFAAPTSTRDADAVAAPVLVVHARDDHHVPIDFALAAVARHPAGR